MTTVSDKPAIGNGDWYELQATNELMRFEARGSQNFVNCYPIRNHGTRPLMFVSHGPDNWQPSYAGGFDMQNDRNHYSTVSGGEIILMSTRTPSGKLYPPEAGQRDLPAASELQAHSVREDRPPEQEIRLNKGD